MHETMLTHAVIGLIHKAVSGLSLATPGGGRKAPEVINGFLPPKRDARDDFPFVSVLPVKGSTDDDRAEVELRIEVGAWSEEFAGYEDAVEVMARIRTALLLMPDRVLDGRYRLVTPVSWNMDEEQPYPGWLMTMTTTWEAPSPEVEVSTGVDDYGFFRN